MKRVLGLMLEAGLWACFAWGLCWLIAAQVAEWTKSTPHLPKDAVVVYYKRPQVMSTPRHLQKVTERVWDIQGSLESLGIPPVQVYLGWQTSVPLLGAAEVMMEPEHLEEFWLGLAAYAHEIGHKVCQNLSQRQLKELWEVKVRAEVSGVDTRWHGGLEEACAASFAAWVVAHVAGHEVYAPFEPERGKGLKSQVDWAHKFWGKLEIWWVPVR